MEHCSPAFRTLTQQLLRAQLLPSNVILVFHWWAQRLPLVITLVYGSLTRLYWSVSSILMPACFNAAYNLYDYIGVEITGARNVAALSGLEVLLL